MPDREYTQDEINAAWEMAGKLEGEDPEKIRVDDFPHGGGAGVCIQRHLFQQKVPGGWVIDEDGRARHDRYKWAMAVQGARRRHETDKAQLSLIFQKQAEEAGIPDAWHLFERIAQLEATLRQQQQQIDRLTNAISRH